MKNTRIKKSVLFFLTAFLILLVGVAAILLSPSKGNKVETANAAETLEGNGLVDETNAAVPYAATTVTAPVFYTVIDGKEQAVNSALGKNAAQYEWRNDNTLFNTMVIKPFDPNKMSYTANNGNWNIVVDDAKKELRATLAANIWSANINTYYIDVVLKNKLDSTTQTGDIWSDNLSSDNKRFHFVSTYWYFEIPKIIPYNEKDVSPIDQAGRTQIKPYDPNRAYFSIEGNSSQFSIVEVRNMNNNTTYTISSYTTWEVASGNRVGRLNFYTTTVAQWRLILRLANQNYMRWMGSNDNGDLYYYFTLQPATTDIPRIIDTQNGGALKIDSDRTRVDYDGNVHSLYVNANSDVVNVTSWNGTAYQWVNNVTVIKNGKSEIMDIGAVYCPAQNAGAYTLRLALKNTTNYRWADGSTADKYLYLDILRAKVEMPEFYQGKYKLDKDGNRVTDDFGAFVYEWKKVDGNTITVPYSATDEYAVKLTGVFAPDKLTNTIGAGSFKSQYINAQNEWIAVIAMGSNSGAYRLDLTPTANYAWNPGGATAALQFTVNIAKCIVEPLIPYEGDKPEASDIHTLNYTTEFTDGGKTVYLTYIAPYMATSISWYTAVYYNASGALTGNGISSSYYSYTIDSANNRLVLTFKTAGQYQFDVNLRNATSFEWLGGGTTYLRFTVTVTPKLLETPKYYQILTDKDGKETRVPVTSTTVDVVYGQTQGVIFEAEGLDNARITPSSNNNTYLSVAFYTDPATNRVTNRVRMSLTRDAGYSSAATIEGDVCASYNASFAIKKLNYESHMWRDTNSTTNQTFYIRVVKAEIAMPLYYLEDGTENGAPKYKEIDNNEQVPYTGSPYHIRFAPYNSAGMSYSTAVPSGSNGISLNKNADGELILNVPNANVYTITITLSKYYKWTGTTETVRPHTFTVQRQTVSDIVFYYLDKQYSDLSDEKLTEIFSTSNPKIEYAYEDHLYVLLKGAESGRISIGNLTGGLYQQSWSGTNLIYRINYGRPGTYTIPVTPGGNYCWPGGGTATQNFVAVVNKKSVKIPELKVEPEESSRDVHITENTNGNVGYTKQIEAAYQMTTARPLINAKVTLIGEPLSGTKNVWRYNTYSGTWALQTGYGSWDNIDGNALNDTPYAGTSEGRRVVAVSTSSVVNAPETTYYLRIRLDNTDYYQWENGNTSLYSYYYVNQLRHTISDTKMYYVEQVDDENDEGEPIKVDKLTDFTTMDTRVYRAEGYDIRVSNAPYNKTNVTVSGVRELDGAAISGIQNIVRYPTDNDYSLHLTTAGTYTISIAPWNHGAWTGGITGARTYTFIITRQEYTIPVLRDCDSDNPFRKTVTYNASLANLHTLVISTWDSNTSADIFNQVNITKNNNLGAPSQANDGTGNVTFTATTALNYSTSAYAVTLTLKDTVNYKYTDGKTAETYNLFVNRLTVKKPVIRTDDGYEDGGSFLIQSKTVTYTGQNLSMIIDGLNRAQFTWSYPNYSPNAIQDVKPEDDPTSENNDPNSTRFYAAESRTYTVRVTLINDNYMWDSGTRETYDLSLIIERKMIDIPKIDDVRAMDLTGDIKGQSITLNYTGAMQYITITGCQPQADGTQVRIHTMYNSGVNVTYTPGTPNQVIVSVQNVNSSWYVRFEIYNGNYRWSDTLDTGYKYYYFYVTAQNVALPTINAQSVENAKTNFKNRDAMKDMKVQDTDPDTGLPKVDEEGNPVMVTKKGYTVQATDPFLHDTAFVVNNTLYSEYLGMVDREDIRISGWQSFTINAERQFIRDVTWTGGNGSSADNTNWTTENNTLLIKARVATTYVFTFALNNNNYRWADGTTGNQTITFVIAPTTVTTPHIEGSPTPLSVSYEYKTDDTGAGVTQEIKISPVDNRIINQTVATIGNEGVWAFHTEYDPVTNYVTSAWGTLTGTRVATYKPVLQLKDKTSYKWQDGTTTDITYTMTITQKKLATPRYFYYEDQEILDDEGEPTGKTHEVAVPISGTSYSFNFDNTIHKFLLTGVDPLYLNYNAVAPAANGSWEEPASLSDGNLVFGARTVAYTNTNYNVITSYSMTIIIKDKANFVWLDGNTTTDRTFTFTINRKRISIPTIDDNASSSNMFYKYYTFDNEKHDFLLKDVDLEWIDYSMPYPTALENNQVEERNGNELYAKSATVDIWGRAGAATSYPMVRLSLKDQRNIQWSDGQFGTAYKDYYIYIQRKYVPVPSVIGTNSVKYTGNTITFQIQNVLDQDWMYWQAFTRNSTTVSLDGTSHLPPAEQGYVYSLDTKTDILSITVPADVATYYITYRINGYNNSNTGWANQIYSNYWYYDKGIYLYVTKAQLPVPSIDGVTGYKKTVTYDGTLQTFDILDYYYTGDNNLNTWERLSVTTTLKFDDYMADLSMIGKWDAEKKKLKLTATAVGTYTLRISTTGNAQFTDGSTYKDYTLVIDKKMYTSPTFVNDSIGSITATNKTVIYNFASQTAVIENIIENNQTNGSMYIINNNNTNLLTAVYNQEKGTYTLTATAVGTYYIDIYVRDTVNTRWTTTTAAYIRYAFVISKASLTIPSSVKTPIIDTEYFSGNNKYVTYTGKKYTLTIKDVDKTYMNWADVTNYAGKADDHKAVLVYDDDAKTLTVTAQFVLSYRIDITLKDCPNNTQWTSTYWYDRDTALKTYYLTITQFAHAYPRVASGTATSVQYSGANQNFSISYVFSGSEKYEIPSTSQGKLTEVSWTSDGLLTFSAKEVGTYQVVISIIDTESTTWNSTNSKSLTFTFYINKRTVQAEITFTSAIPSVNTNISNANYRWPSGVPVYAMINLTGLASGANETIALSVYVYRSGYSNIKTNLKETSPGSRQYLLPMAPEYTNPVIAYYYIVVEHDGEANKTDNYSMSTISTRFYIDSIATTFTENDLSWQYTVGGGAANLIGTGTTHNTVEKALELSYQGKEIKFSLANTDNDLANKKVRVVSYDGDISATDYKSTTYCVSVTIGTNDTAAYFPNTTYYLYYKINKAKFNLSQLAWDYSAPFTYDGSAKNVKVEGLPEGLSISSYTGDRNMINATEGTDNHYNTSVTFTISNDNYVVPEQGKTSTYSGSFNWTCTWDINKAPIDILWKDVMKVDLDSLSIMYVPVLTTGDEMVTYKYQKKNQATNAYEPVANVSKLLGETVYFSVEAVLKAEFTSNYKLVTGDGSNADNPHFFEVGADSYAVVMHLELNGKTGTSFPYTGEGYKALAVIDDDGTGAIEAETTKLTYYSVSSTGTETALAANQLPTNVGKYKVAVEVAFWISGNEENKMKGQNEFEFEIVKGVIDTSKYIWQLNHGDRTYTYDADQGKWVDYYNAEVLEFPYDGEEYSISLTGAETGDAITFTNDATGTFKGTNASSYNAIVVAAYDDHNWEKPVFAWEETMSSTNARTFTWTIAKQKIDATMVRWDYTSPFTYAVDASGKATAYSVNLINVPESIADKILYKTGTSSGSHTSTNVGKYNTSFTVESLGPNYEVVFSDTLKNPLAWEISNRIITAPVSNGSWTLFDGNAHEIAKVLNLPADWSNYFTVEMTVDGESVPFTGDYKATNAGTYAFTFKLKSEVKANVSWTSDGGITTNDQKTQFTVAPSTVTVAGWTAAGKDSKVILSPEGTSPDIFEYKIYKVNGETETLVTGDNDEVWKRGDATIRIRPVLKAEHAKNVTVVFPEGSNYEYYEFKTDFPDLVRLDKPRMAGETSVEYDGKPHTFLIGGWEEYSKYLDIYVEDKDDTGAGTGDYSQVDADYLTQTKAGSYEILLRFKDSVKNSNAASWKTTDGSNDIVQSDVTLYFEITVKTISAPTIGSYVYTGSEIDVGAMIEEQCGADFVTVSGVSKATATGEYTVRVSLKDADSCIWSDGTTGEKSITWSVTGREFSTPNGDGWTMFDGDVHDLSAVCGLEDGYATFFDITIRVQQTTTTEDGEEKTEFVEYTGYNGDKLMAMDAGIYEVTFTFKSTMGGATWEDQSKTPKVAIVSVAKYVVKVTGWNKNNENSTVMTEDGINNKFFTYQIWQDSGETNEDGTPKRELITADKVATAGAGKTFYMNLSVLPEFSSNVDIIYSDASYETYAFTTKLVELMKPKIQNPSYDSTNPNATPYIVFTGDPFTFVLQGWDSVKNYVEVTPSLDYLTQTNVGEYYLTISFKDGVAATWSAIDGGGTSSLILKFEIKPLELEKPKISNIAYDGKEHDVFAALAAEYGDFVTVLSGDKGTNAGRYELKLRFAKNYDEEGKYANGNCVWKNGNSNDLTIVWNITATQLPTPADTGKWTTFDGKEHNLFEVLGLPENWDIYCDLTAELDGTTLSAEACKTVKNAGKYKLTFKLKDGLNPDGAQNVVFINGTQTSTDAVTVEITVAKLTITVTGWNKAMADSTVNITGGDELLAFISYRFTRDGVVVDRTVVDSAADGTEFAKEIVVDETNITLVREEGVSNRYLFTIGVLDVEPDPERLAFPKMVYAKLAYTGERLTFAIANWTEYYGLYLEIADGNLMQTEIGTYTVTLRFTVGPKVATWNDEEYTQDSYTLSFEIYDQGLVQIQKPTFAAASKVYTGEELDFDIIAWEYLSQYIEIVDGDELTQTEVGTYSVVFRFKEGISAMWADDHTSDEYTLYFYITEELHNYTQVSKPHFAESVKIYTGEELTFEIVDWDYYSRYFLIDGDAFTQTEIGKYTVTFTFRDGVEATWADGSTNAYTLTFEIREEGSSTIPGEPGEAGVKLTKPVIDSATVKIVNGVPQFEVANWDELADYIEMVEGSLTQIVAGEKYSVQFRLKEDANATWIDGSTGVITVTFSTVAPIDPSEVHQLAKPQLSTTSKQYTGKEIDFFLVVSNLNLYKEFLDIDGDGFADDRCTLTEVGVYSITFTFKEGCDVTWADGDTERSFTLTFSITERRISGVWDTNGDTPKFVITQPEDAEIPDSVLDTVITEVESGKVVSASDVKEGKDYKVTLSVNPTYEGSYELASDAGMTYTFHVDENGIVDGPGNGNNSNLGTPGNPGSEGAGLDGPFLYISVGLGVVLLIFLMAVIGIVCFELKSKSKAVKASEKIAAQRNGGDDDDSDDDVSDEEVEE